MRVLAATLCACLALWAARTLSDAMDIQAEWGPRATVLLARHDIAAGQTIDRTDIVERSIPRSLIPPNALNELPPGATTNAMVLAGEPLVKPRLTDSGGYLAPKGTTAVRLDLAVGAPALHHGDRVDVLGQRGNDLVTDVIPTSMPENRTEPSGEDPGNPQVAVVSRAAVVLRPPTEDDPSIEVAVDDAEVAQVAGAAFTGGVAVVRRTP